MTTEHVRLSELIEDHDIYPRGSVSDVHADDLGYALDAGAVLPPPVIDRATRKIVDGVHRTRAYRKRLGDDGAIDVDMQEFDGDAAMLLESARLNHLHGLPLGRNDQRWVHIRAVKLGAGDDEIAAALGLTPARLSQVKIRVAHSSNGDIPTKRGTEHLSSSYLTDDQAAELRRMRGAPARSKATELARLLRNDMTPLAQDPALRQALSELAAVIEDVLSPYAAEE